MTTTRLLLAALALASTSLTANAQAKSKDKTKKGDDSPQRVQVWRSESSDDERAVIGVSTSSSGERDTLGLLITAVTEGGPAEKAGLEEGTASCRDGRGFLPPCAGERREPGPEIRRWFQW